MRVHVSCSVTVGTCGGGGGNGDVGEEGKRKPWGDQTMSVKLYVCEGFLYTSKGVSESTRYTVAVLPPATAQKQRSGLRLMLTAAQSLTVRAPAKSAARGTSRRCARGRTHSPLSGSLGPNGAIKSIVLSPLLIPAVRGAAKSLRRSLPVSSKSRV